MAVLKGKTTRLFAAMLALTLLGMALQVVPFLVYRPPPATGIEGALPPGYPADYSYADFARAHVFVQPLLLGGLARNLTGIAGLLAVLASGMAGGIGDDSGGGRKDWLKRILFLAGLFLWLQALDLPFNLSRYLHYRAFGLTRLGAGEWIGTMIAGLAVPLAVFVLKYVLVSCSIPLFKRWWWLASVLLVFLTTSVCPELISRTLPADPVQRFSPIRDGPHAEAIRAALERAAVSMSIVEVDQSRRSERADICVSGRPGREYVLVTDTFLRDFSPEETTLAVGHEIGHFQRRFRTLFIEKAVAFLTLLTAYGTAFLLCGRQAPPLSSAMRVVTLVVLSLSVWILVLGPVSNAISRREERLADRYAARLAACPEQYDRLLVKIAKHNIQPLDLPLWQYWLFASHPTVIERIKLSRGK